jgi:hypothetical protein
MVVLDASRRGQPVPRLAAWSLGAGIVATVSATSAQPCSFEVEGYSPTT